MAEKVSRVISMLRLIPREPKWISTRNIQSRLEEINPDFKVNLRTIQRDLQDLSASFALTENGKGWSFMAESEYLQLPDMTWEIALGFKMIDNFLDKMLPKTVIDFLKPYTMKADEILQRSSQKGDYIKWMDKVAILPYNPLLPAEVSPELMHLIYDAVLRQKEINVRLYQKGYDDAESFRTDPLGIVIRDSTVYLVCTTGKDRKKVGYRPLQRFKEVEVTENDCIIPEGFTLRDYINQGEFQWLLSDKKMKFEAEIDKNIAYMFFESKLAPDQKIEELENGNIILRATVQDTNNFRFYLQSLSDRVRVIKPKRLAKEFEDIARNLARLYEINKINYQVKSF